MRAVPEPAGERHRVVGGREDRHPGQGPDQPDQTRRSRAPERREFEYERNGTAVLFAGLDVHEGERRRLGHRLHLLGQLRHFLWDLMDQTPEGLDLHCIVDNLAAHQTDKVADFLVAQPPGAPALHAHPRQWLNQVELFFSILERRLLRRGEFASVDELADASSPSSRTTTAGRRRSAGPTTAAHFGPRKSQ